VRTPCGKTYRWEPFPTGNLWSDFSCWEIYSDTLQDFRPAVVNETPKNGDRVEFDDESDGTCILSGDVQVAELLISSKSEAKLVITGSLSISGELEVNSPITSITGTAQPPGPGGPVGGQSSGRLTYSPGRKAVGEVGRSA
jgi:hypothetical protein